jgi:hypothetical protein
VKARAWRRTRWRRNDILTPGEPGVGKPNDDQRVGDARLDEYLTPASLDEAFAVDAHRGRFRLVAGATDTFPGRARAGPGRGDPDADRHQRIPS